MAQSLDDALWQRAAGGGDKENRPNRPAAGPAGGAADGYGGGGCGGVRLLPVGNDGRRAPPAAANGGYRRL